MRGVSKLLVVVFAVGVGCGPPDRLAIDASMPGDGGNADTSSTGKFGDSCTVHLDCESGYCVEPAGGAGGQCSRLCANDCPTGWDCLGVDFPETQVDLCVPANGRLCAPCATDNECPGGACVLLDGSFRCASDCGTSQNCPTGYTCAPDGAGTHPGMFCQPVTQSCTCSMEVAGAQRTCTTMNAIGTCYGVETCGATGWSACSARIAANETCDGVDNDCDFVIDDGVGGGAACTNTNAFGSCAGVQTCGGAAGFTCNGPVPMAESCNSIDDNCNGSTDETFTGLGNLCSAGVGACTRYGSMRCNTAGTGIECGAVAGAPVAEACNQVDDNCDGAIDDAFPTLGNSCTTGVGVCQRFGTVICSTNMLTTTCSAVAGAPTGSESCNFLDDDCDGTVDNPFRNGQGVYYQDQNCGACGINCSGAFPGAQNAISACVVQGTAAACGLSCQNGAYDLNSTIVDGCEFIPDTTAIYVSGSDSTSVDDATCGLAPNGAGGHACKSIGFGMVRAGMTSRPKVLVADGTYTSQLILVNGLQLLGGYNPDTWVRHLATTATTVQGVTLIANHEVAVFAENLTLPTVFEGFVVRGPQNARPSGNSYAIYISNCSSNLTIRNNVIFGGRGGSGPAGAAGVPGLNGVSGQPFPGLMDSFQATGTGACNASNNRLAGGGGQRVCPGNDFVDGGAGGGNNCAPVGDTQASTAASQSGYGLAADAVGGGSSGLAGTRGWDSELAGSTCLLPSDAGGNLLPRNGTEGVSGGDGAVAPAVGGCTNTTGSVVAGHWIGAGAPTGQVGSHGGGGGGGGAGGGAFCNNCALGDMMHDVLGGRGGGGGSGACGGNGGVGGIAGGGSFGVYVIGGAAPTMTSNEINLGTGGAGGRGGIAGAGGIGGNGAQGGLATIGCSGKAGRGGDGGDGGAGSGGGGGCGGSVFGFYTSGVGTPGYCGSNTVTGGTGGTGGAGGFSSGNSGGTGASGSITQCTSI